jgi:hypothetical protein
MAEPLQHVLTACLGELRDWRSAHPEAGRYRDDVYARIERILRQLRRIDEAREVERLVLEIEQLVRDEGPLSEEFMPSLEQLHAAVSNPRC